MRSLLRAGCGVVALVVVVAGTGGPSATAMVPAGGPAIAGSALSTASRAAWEQEVLRLTNRARAKRHKCGRKSYPAASALRRSSTLARAARKHSADMGRKGYFSHTSRSGATLADRATREGYDYSWLGENIAAGQRSPKEVVQAWLDSPGHCRNIMNPNFTELGVGYAYTTRGKYHHYWTQDFGHPA